MGLFQPDAWANHYGRKRRPLIVSAVLQATGAGAATESGADTAASTGHPLDVNYTYQQYTILASFLQLGADSLGSALVGTPLDGDKVWLPIAGLANFIWEVNGTTNPSLRLSSVDTLLDNIPWYYESAGVFSASTFNASTLVGSTGGGAAAESATPDTAAGFGGVAVTGFATAVETGSDTAIGTSGGVGAGAATETGSDAAAAVGLVQQPVTGAGAGQESGDDTASGAGLLSPYTPPVSNTTIDSSVSEITICSNALLALGAKPISSFNEAEQAGALDRAQLCANLWPNARDAVLRSHPWNCATKRVQLAPDITAPAFDWTNRFLLPGDWLRVLTVGRKRCEEDYELEGRYILANVSVLPLRYIWRNYSVASWDVMLIQAMELMMQAKLAYAITASTSKEQSCLAAFESFMKQVRAVDGQENPPEELGDYPFLRARYAGGR